jgi:hypothetical protein
VVLTQTGVLSVILQIGLYSLVSLAELCDAAAEAPQPAAGCLSSSTSSQRQQRTQQQQLPPVLPPMATLRLPAKVSSIAFSPDMQGVISIGDYDGTLTQVRMASCKVAALAAGYLRPAAATTVVCNVICTCCECLAGIQPR